MVLPNLVLLILALFQCSLAQNDKLDSLGFGMSYYDGTFDQTRLRARILDLGDFTTLGKFQVRQKTDTRFIDNLYRQKHAEEGFDEFSSSLKTSVSIGGGYAGFKANVKARYNSDVTERTDYYFSRVATVVERAHMRISVHSPGELRGLVLPGVKAELETLQPWQIFYKYGTHVTTGLAVGGMLELWSSGHKYNFKSKEEFSVSVSASYLKIVSGSASLTLEQQRAAQKVQSREGLLIHGGTLDIGADHESRWIASTADNVQAVKFLSNGAVPIWALISDAAQAGRVRDYFERVVVKHTLIVKRFESPPVNALPRVPHPHAEVYVPTGWKVVSGGAFAKFYGVGQLLTKSYPIVSGGRPVGWRAASKDHLQSDRGQVQAFAVAIWDPKNAWDVVARWSYSSVAAHPSATARLPSGYVLIGGGADVRYKEPGNMLVETYPSSSLSWTSSSKDHLKSAPSSLVSYAIGIKHRHGGTLRYRVRTGYFGPLQHPSGSIYATKGWSFVGAGARVSKGGVGNMLVRIVPGRHGKDVYAYGKDHLRADARSLTIYGIEVEGATYVVRTESVLGLDPESL